MGNVSLIDEIKKEILILSSLIEKFTSIASNENLCAVIIQINYLNNLLIHTQKLMQNISIDNYGLKLYNGDVENKNKD